MDMARQRLVANGLLNRAWLVCQDVGEPPTLHGIGFSGSFCLQDKAA
nr:hypothetical protein [uncultured Kingella sp.]